MRLRGSKLIAWVVAVLLWQVSGTLAQEDSVSASDNAVGLYARLQANDLATADLQALDTSSGLALLEICTVFDDASCVSKLVNLSFAIDEPNAEGLTPLVLAVGADSVEAAATLIANGADPLKDGPWGSAAEYALNAGSVEMIQTVVSDASERAQAMLMRAAEAGNLAGIADALELGADVNVASADGATALLVAMLTGAHAAMEALLDQGARPSAELGQPQPLALAIMADDPVALELLLGAGADPNGLLDGLPPLSLAALSGQIEVVETLLEAGADPETTDADGVRPAAVALAMGFPELAERLGGAPELAPAPDLVGALERGDEQAAMAAIEAGADPNQVSASGWPALHLAVSTANVRLVESLLLRSPNILSVGPDRSSVLHAALATEAEGARVSLVLRILTTARAQGAQADLLSMEDASGRSAAVLLGARLPSLASSAAESRNSKASQFGQSLDRSAIEAAMRAEDVDGVDPYEAAVLSDNILLLGALRQLGVDPPARDQSLQDLARANGALGALSALPDDRELPAGVGLPSSAEAMLDLQRRLAEWGYYAGEVDGVFGAGSRAALALMLKDRGEELLSMARGDYLSSSGLRFEEPSADMRLDEPNVLLSGVAAGSCSWTVARWSTQGPAGPSGPVGSVVACVEPREGSLPWRGFGVSLLTYQDGREAIIFDDGQNREEYVLGAQAEAERVEVSAQAPSEAAGEWWVVAGSCCFDKSYAQWREDVTQASSQCGFNPLIDASSFFDNFRNVNAIAVIGPYLDREAAARVLPSVRACIPDAYLGRSGYSG